VEIYNQVNHNFRSFLEKNWKSLQDWVYYIQSEEDDHILDFIKIRQREFKFSEFYFIDCEGNYITPNGGKGIFLLEGGQDCLFQQKDQLIINETLPTGQAVTLFAVPVSEGIYQDFPYKAVGISYTNDDIIQSLDINAFSDQSKCFVVYTDGSVLLSTQNGGGIFENYISYLRAESDLDEKALEQMRQDWENQVSSVLRCQIGGVSHYISYQLVGYQDCVLLGVVPESAASASLIKIQHVTIDVLIKIFLLISSFLILQFVSYVRKQRKASALEIQYRELMFDTLSNNVDDICLMLNGETWEVDYLSPNVERLLGITLADVMEDISVLGDTLSSSASTISAEELLSIPIHGCLQLEREHIHHSTGEQRWYREMVYREKIQDTEKFIVVMSDRTQEKQMTQNLQEALNAAKSANEAKSHFLSNMSHDIRTPMNAIIGFSVLLAKDADRPDKVREYTRKIAASSQHLLSLINDVLDMSKIESGKTSLNTVEFSLPELLEELYSILQPQAKAKHQTLEFHAQGHPAEHLIGDKLHLNQILINLLSNAIKYTQEGGEISFIVEELSKHSTQYAHLRFIVRDNGFGMSGEFLDTVFDPFAREVNDMTRKIQGTGLGMAITKNLIELMGGVIQVDSQLGKGTVFTVELSFAVPVSWSAEKDAFWRRQKISRVLVADDDEDICLEIQEAMRRIGVDVSYTTEGEEAVKMAAQAQKAGKAFHVILLDWRMPGLSGAETARWIREEVSKEIPLVVLSAYDWSDIEDEAREAGIDAFLPKPFFVSTFQQVMSTIHPNIEEAEDKTEPEESVLDGLLFLAAEDNELNAEILSEMLDMEGAKCEIAVNGKVALEMFQKSEINYYDMILMDIQMDVMDGYEATQQIRSCNHPRAKTIPIVAMTANAFAEDVRNALDAGMDGHLAKPIDMAEVKKILGRLRQTAEGK
jgi:signal transduction histidine kinase/DNA-binding response OmpR family regulator